MAWAPRLIVALGLAVATAGRAAGPCEEERLRTGLALAPAVEGLAVAALDAESAADASGLRAGDVVLQVNGTVPRSCADYARVVREACRDHKALLVLVRRTGGDVPLALAAAVWERVVAAAPAPAPEPPSVRVLVGSTPAPSIPPPARMTLAEVLHDLDTLAAVDPARGHLAAYRGDLRHLHGAVETLAAGGTVARPVVAGLETVLRYHDAAAVAWGAEEAVRERDRRPRHLPSSAVTAAPYFTESEVASTLDEFPFLQATVVREPRPGGLAGESAGLWHPVEARRLLLEHARSEAERLAGWLGMGTP